MNEELKQLINTALDALNQLNMSEVAGAIDGIDDVVESLQALLRPEEDPE